MNYVEFAVGESGRCVCRFGGFPISTLLEQHTAYIVHVLNILIKFVAKIFDVKWKIKYNYKQRISLSSGEAAPFFTHILSTYVQYLYIIFRLNN